MSAERDGFSQSIDQISFYGQCMRGQNDTETEMILTFERFRDSHPRGRVGCGGGGGVEVNKQRQQI